MAYDIGGVKVRVVEAFRVRLRLWLWGSFSLPFYRLFLVLIRLRNFVLTVI